MPPVTDLFHCRDRDCFPVCLVFCPENVAWLSSYPGHTGHQFLYVQVVQRSGWGPKIQLGINMGTPNLKASILPTITGSQGDCLSFFWLSLGVDLDLGRSESFAPLGMPLHPWLSHRKVIDFGFESLDRYTFVLKEKSGKKHI